jgi:uncharacterized membrane protein YbhN (UPF0104 family)
MKKFLGIFVRLVISVALLWYVFSSIDDKEKILTVLLNANWQYLLAGFLFFFVHYATVFWRWHFVLNTIGHIKIAAKSILLSLLGGNILGLITPGRVGELARGLFVREKDFWEITGLTLLEKAYANSISIVFGVAAFLILGYDAPFASSVFVGVLLILLALALILIFLPAKFAVILLFLQQILPGRLQKIIAPLVNPLQQLNTWRSLKLAFLSALVNISAFIEFMLFLNAFSDVALFPAFWAFEAAYFTTTLLPLTFSGIGIKETTRIHFFGLLGVAAIPVLNTSLLMFLVNGVMPGLIGVLVVPKVKLSRKPA